MEENRGSLQSHGASVTLSAYAGDFRVLLEFALNCIAPLFGCCLTIGDPCRTGQGCAGVSWPWVGVSLSFGVPAVRSASSLGGEAGKHPLECRHSNGLH